jgi:hypothetical protein
MTRPLNWIAFVAATLLAAAVAIPAIAQDKSQSDAEQTLSAIVRIKTKIIKDARSAETLGLQREGSGVLIRDGYVLTIGYLVMEAEGDRSDRGRRQGSPGGRSPDTTTRADSGCSGCSRRSQAGRCRSAMRPCLPSARRR